MSEAQSTATQAEIITLGTGIESGPSLDTIKKASSQLKDEIVKQENIIPHPINLRALKTIDNTYHHKAISFKAVSAVGLGFNILDERGQIIPEDKWPSFLVTANPLESFHEVILSAYMDFEEVGGGHIEVIQTRKGDPAELYWVPGETMYLNKSKDTFIQELNGKTVHFTPFGLAKQSDRSKNQMIRFKYPSNRSTFYGRPDWIGAVGSMILDALAVEWNYRFFKNNAIPALAVIVEGGEFDKDTKALVRDFLTQSVKGIDNSHKTLYLPINDPNIKVRFEKIMAEVKDADFQKLRTSIRDEVLSGHGVPPRIMGVITSGSLGGGGEAEQQLKIFKEVSVSPKQQLFESVINRTLLAGTGMRIKFRSIDLSSDTSDIENVRGLVQDEILTPEEGRNMLDIEDVSKSEAASLLAQIVRLRNTLKSVSN
jgi:PBSX family phage portal protein